MKPQILTQWHSERRLAKRILRQIVNDESYRPEQSAEMIEDALSDELLAVGVPSHYVFVPARAAAIGGH